MSVAVLGGGAWGTTLALLLARKDHAVRVWEYQASLAASVEKERENRLYLPGMTLPPSVRFTGDLAEALDGADVALFVVPSQATRAAARAAAIHVRRDALVVTATKGLERSTLRFMTDVIASEIPGAHGEVVALAGPSIAREVADGVPTAVVAASRSAARAREAQELFSTARFRVYTNEDVTGVELGVALKNVIAIAAGLSDGLGYGTNTKAALITRGLAEMTRLGVAMGAKPLTFAGLAGIGDMVTTCMNPRSRNRRVGEAMARGGRLEEVLRDLVEVAEGVETTPVALELAGRHGVELPIATQVHRVLFEGRSPADAVTELMTRVPTGETAHTPSAASGGSLP